MSEMMASVHLCHPFSVAVTIRPYVVDMNLDASAVQGAIRLDASLMKDKSIPVKDKHLEHIIFPYIPDFYSEQEVIAKILKRPCSEIETIYRSQSLKRGIIVLNV